MTLLLLAVLPTFAADTGDTGAEDPAAAIQAVVQRNHGRVQVCLDRALKADPALAGRIAVGWDIRDGVVSHAHLVSDTTGDPKLGACMVEAVTAFRFGGDINARVDEYPWVVSAASEG